MNSDSSIHPWGQETKSTRLLHRRNFLKHGMAAMGASSFLAKPSAGNDSRSVQTHSDKPTAYIDCHVHVWSHDAQCPLATPNPVSGPEPSTALPDNLLRVARTAGVNRIVLIQPGCYEFDNSYMLDAIRRAPTVFRGVAKLDWHQSNPDVEMRKLKPHGVRGFRIWPEGKPGPLNFQAEGFEKMFRCAAQERMTLSLLVDPDALPVIAKQCERFPETPVAIDHFGRIGSDGRIHESDVQAMVKLAKFRHVKIKVSAFYALGAKRPPHQDLAPLIHRVYDAFGPQRMMWGSDCPYQIRDETYEDSISLVRDRLDFLSHEDRDWILRRSAELSFFED